MTILSRAASVLTPAHRIMLGRAWRFLLVALVNNGLTYGLFVVLIWRGLSTPISLALAYVCGVLLTFFVNQKYSFQQMRGSRRQFSFYILLYLSCYILNVSILRVAKEYYRIPEQITQIALVFVLGGLIFVTLHYFIFAVEEGEPFNE